ncbi:MAG: iron-sulfur cluster assembly accessory protein [Deltaproteobacteria bacterium]|nr:iron-sulfur cluster assembly accessory protein [Deltaproteobacteria bacterium]
MPLTLTYFMDFVDAPTEKDEVFQFEGGVQVCVDRKSHLFLNGTEIDFERGLLKTGFVFNNPLATRSCSCGESFTV